MSVIEFATTRRDDPNNEDYETRYWAAYLDGAKAQAKEDLIATSRMIDRRERAKKDDDCM